MTAQRCNGGFKRLTTIFVYFNAIFVQEIIKRRSPHRNTPEQRSKNPPTYILSSQVVKWHYNERSQESYSKTSWHDGEISSPDINWYTGMITAWMIRSKKKEEKENENRRGREVFSFSASITEFPWIDQTFRHSVMSFTWLKTRVHKCSPNSIFNDAVSAKQQ